MRVTGIVATTLLCGAATAVAGPIALHRARRAARGPRVHRARQPVDPARSRWSPGAILVLVSDVIGRLVLWPSELEVSVVTAVIGAPVFIPIVRRRRLAQL